MKYRKYSMHSQDILILLKIIAIGDKEWYHHTLADEIGLSQSEVSQSLNRSLFAGLIDAKRKNVMKLALCEFLKHGIKYVFPEQPGAIVRGMPTSHSASPLNKHFTDSEAYVWPTANGKIRGQAITPLYPSAVFAAEKDQKLYELLTLVDALRVGKAREKEMASNEIEKIMLGE